MVLVNFNAPFRFACRARAFALAQARAMTRFGPLAGALAVLLVLAPPFDAAWPDEAAIGQASQALQNVEIATKEGVQVFRVELARSEAEREKGLMYRRALPDGQGMLFDFGGDQDVAMWMKNTYIPLDMIFIRGDGTIARIAENTEPHSLAIIASGGPVRGVLEVIAGTAKKYGIAPGDMVAHPMFRPR